MFFYFNYIGNTLFFNVECLLLDFIVRRTLYIETEKFCYLFKEANNLDFLVTYK